MTQQNRWHRLFFAIEIDAPTTTLIQETIIRELQQQPAYDNVRWIKKENLHITLHFLKAVNTADVDMLLTNAEKMIKQNTAFDLTVSQLGPFPHQHHPKYLALLLPEDTKLFNLVQSIGQAITSTGIIAENRPYRGHLTLGKMHSTQQAVVEPSRLPHPLTIRVLSVTLFESKPQPGASHYLALARHPLQTP